MTFSVKQIDKGGYYMKGFKKLTAGFLGVVMALGVCGFTALAAGNVARIEGGDEYSTLQEAIEKAENGDTIVLIDDTTENVVIDGNKELTIDLNGKVLSGGTDKIDGEVTEHKDKPAILNKGEVTIIDSDGGGEIKRDDVNVGSDSYYVIDNQGTMTIKGGYIHNDSGVGSSGSSLIRNGGISTEGYKQGYAVLNIEGGVFEQDNFIVIKNDDYGELNITGGEFNSENQSAVQNWAEANISGGEINGLVWTLVWDEKFPNSNTNFSGDVEVNGIIKAGKDGNPSGVVPKVTVNGGTFDVEWDIPSGLSENIKVKNGNFKNSVPENFIAEDSNLVKDKNGNFVIKDEEEFEGSEFYISNEDDLKLAIANQANGVTWVFEDKTYDLKSTIKITEDVTIEGNGAVLNYTEDIANLTDASERCGFNIDNGANVEINDLTIEGNRKIRHGVNVYTGAGQDTTTVTLNNVTMKDGTGYGLVNNASDVTVTDIETSGNGWGGINVDNAPDTSENGAKFVMNSGVINESYSVAFENKTGAKIDAEIKDGTFKGYVGYGVNEDSFGAGVVPENTVDINITSGTFATDVEKFIDEDSHIVKIDGEYVVYDDQRDSHRHSYSLKEGKTERDDEEEEPVVTPEPEEEEGPFSDVGKDNPNYDAIVEVYEKGWMAGIGDGVFAPNGTLTRGMAVTILWNRAGQPEPASVAPFLDVTSDAWYAKAVAWAYENGITSGYGDTYGPDDFLTTEQFTRMNDIANGRTPEVYVGGAPNATRGWVAGLLVME